VADVYLGKSNAATPVDLPEGNRCAASSTPRPPAGRRPGEGHLVAPGVHRQGPAAQGVPGRRRGEEGRGRRPKTIGYIDKSAVDGSVKVLVTLN
jgi:hypothetical protein